MRLLGSTTEETKNKNRKNVHHLEITKVVLVHYNIFNNDYQHDSRIFYKFVPNISFGQLLDISLKNFIFLKTFNSKFSFIEVWFTDQNFKILEKMKITTTILIINLSVTYIKQ